MECGRFPVLLRRELAKGVIELWITCPNAVNAAPGQFVGILCEGMPLRRPLSICRTDERNHAFCVVFEVRGAGTQWLAARGKGELLDVLGPLGSGFDLSGCESKSAVFVGGGIGAPPLLAAAQRFGSRADVLLGFRTAASVILLRDFAGTGAHVFIATDDGSAGHRGLVTELLGARLDRAPCDIVYACGPKPMLSAAAEIAAAHGVRCQVSLEERMACGVGACLCCASKIRDASGGEHYRHVCKDGPVFEADQVVF
ncbi:MAG: dihydroorotate dehydrogenase electron transfer subunit [Clostridia bacterium]|nr:dihydroorotate dehydrogenase electron transfer subunit [Clostridia bacterium]